MIIRADGDLLAADVDALVNTVNCVGVMGKGIALQFKRRYPDVFKQYERACQAGEVQIGRMLVIPTHQMSGPRWVIHFPTKKHWRSPSKLEYIDAGLADLRKTIEDLELTSIAIPPLGAGNGGLDWATVQPRIEAALAECPDVDVHLYAPSAHLRPVAGASGVRITWGRALMLDLLRRYVEQRALAEPWEDRRGASHLEIQKLMYFANELDPRLNLDFKPGRYGPYSEKVRHLVQGMEGSLLHGFGDGTSKVLALDPISPTDQAVEELAVYMSNRDLSAERDVATTVMATVFGFEGPYGVELLASTHWVAKNSSTGAEVPQAVREWTKRKGRIFTDSHVSAALRHLVSIGAFDRQLATNN